MYQSTNEALEEIMKNEKARNQTSGEHIFRFVETQMGGKMLMAFS